MNTIYNRVVQHDCNVIDHERVFSTNEAQRRTHTFEHSSTFVSLHTSKIYNWTETNEIAELFCGAKGSDLQLLDKAAAGWPQRFPGVSNCRQTCAQGQEKAAYYFEK